MHIITLTNNAIFRHCLTCLLEMSCLDAYKLWRNGVNKTTNSLISHLLLVSAHKYREVV